CDDQPKPRWRPAQQQGDNREDQHLDGDHDQHCGDLAGDEGRGGNPSRADSLERPVAPDRKSTRLNSSHVSISYAVFGLKKKRSSTITASTRGATTWHSLTGIRRTVTPTTAALQSSTRPWSRSGASAVATAKTSVARYIG